MMLSLSFFLLSFAFAGLVSREGWIGDLLPFYKGKTPIFTSFRDEVSRDSRLPFSNFETLTLCLFSPSHLFSFQTQGGKFFGEQRFKNAPNLYGLAHIVPAIIWSLLIPTQHWASIRRNYIFFHRFSGYLIVLSSISLSISASLFPSYGLSFSDPDILSFHKFPIPGTSFYLPFPTFNQTIKVLPFTLLLPLYMAIKAIRIEKNIQKHRRWMILHTLAGYAIGVQRVLMLMNNVIGWALFYSPDSFSNKVASTFNLPEERDERGVWEVERAAFALTAWLSAFVVMFWQFKLTGKRNLGGKGMRKEL